MADEQDAASKTEEATPQKLAKAREKGDVAKTPDLAMLASFAGAAAVIYTDIARDGMLGGVNVDATAALARAVSLPVIASGGVAGVEDLVALRAAQAGIDDARGDLLPEAKLDAIKEMQKRYGATGMTGDGINDAPALAQADIGFAMGGAGTDTAMEAADVVIMNDNLERVAETVRLSKRTHAILWQNITLALGIKSVFLVMAVVGTATMWMAVFADMGASLLVVANGLRLLRGTQVEPATKPSRSETKEHAHSH